MNKSLPLNLAFGLSFCFWMLPANAQDHRTHVQKIVKNSKGAVPLLKLPIVKTTTTIELKDGQSLTLEAVEVREKIKGTWTRRLAYNGMIPGPTFVAKQGSKVSLTLINKTAIPTTLHSHGLRVTDRNDGVVGVGQDPILPNGQFTYELKFPDLGLHWYHPHIQEDKTQDLGLQGTYLVIAKDIGSSKTPDYSRVVVIDDLLMDKQGIYPFKDGIVTHALMGRYGNMFLVNNRSTDIQNVSKGDVWRYYFVNTANARPFKIAISGAKMKMIASDQGVFEREFFADDFVISPGERYIVDIMFDFIDGKKQASLSAIHPSGPTLLSKFKMSGMATKSEVSSSDFAKLRMNAEESKEFEPIKAKLSQPPLKHLTIDAELTGPHASHMMTKSHSDGIEWDDDMGPMSADITSADVKWFIKDEETKKLNMDINWKFNHNESVKIRIDNKGKTHPMQHPIHFHGQRFVVLARNGKPNDNLAWKDTALLPAGETMDIVLDNQNKGKWMAHCHISEHLAVGMMIGFEVK